MNPMEMLRDLLQQILGDSPDERKLNAKHMSSFVKGLGDQFGSEEELQKRMFAVMSQMQQQQPQQMSPQGALLMLRSAGLG